MDINAFNAVKTYNAAQKALGAEKLSASKTAVTASAPEGEDGFTPFTVAKNMVSAVAKSETAAAAFMTGEADPHSVVEAIASAELAVETAVTLRDRVVEAYQELLRMPI